MVLLTNVFSVDCQIRKFAQFLTEIRFLYLPVQVFGIINLMIWVGGFLALSAKTILI